MVNVSFEEYAEQHLGIPIEDIPEFIRLSRVCASSGVVNMKQAMETIANLVYSEEWMAIDLDELTKK